MPTHTRHPKKPFMIMREDGDGNDFAVCHKTLGMFWRWVDWEGSKFATRDEAQAYIDKSDALKGAKVIEVLEETRCRTRAA